MYNNLFKKLTRKSAYWLGLIAGDGSISLSKDKYYKFSIGLKTEDGYLIENLATDIGYTIDRVHYRHNNATGIAIFYCGQKDLCKDLLDNGIVPQKTRKLDKSIIPKKFQEDFIRGIFDADGSVGLYNKESRLKKILKVSIYGHKPLLIAIQDILQKNNINSRLYDSTRNNGVFSLTISEISSVIRMYHFIYNKKIRYLKRKYLLYKNGLKYLEHYVRPNKSKYEKCGRRYFKISTCNNCHNKYKHRTDKIGNFCSRSCSNIYNNKKKRIYDIWKNGHGYKNVKCKCGNEKLKRTDAYDLIYCSLKCRRKYNANSDSI